MSINKQTKGIYHVRINLEDAFGFAEHQEIWTYGLSYKLTLERNSDYHVLGHPAGANDARYLASAGRVFIDDINLYVPPYTPNISNQELMLAHIVSPTELSYVERSY